MRPTPANIAYLWGNLKGFMIDSVSAWYDSPFMERLDKKKRDFEKTPENMSLGELVRDIRIKALARNADNPEERD
jgi:hypothetical protein